MLITNLKNLLMVFTIYFLIALMVLSALKVNIEVKLITLLFYYLSFTSYTLIKKYE